jgi:hypothetical protein
MGIPVTNVATEIADVTGEIAALIAVARREESVRRVLVQTIAECPRDFLLVGGGQLSVKDK